MQVMVGKVSSLHSGRLGRHNVFLRPISSLLTPTGNTQFGTGLDVANYFCLHSSSCLKRSPFTVWKPSLQLDFKMRIWRRDGLEKSTTNSWDDMTGTYTVFVWIRMSSPSQRESQETISVWLLPRSSAGLRDSYLNYCNTSSRRYPLL